MLCYFDNEKDVNLSHIQHIKEIRTPEELKSKILSKYGFEITYDNNYTQGLYVIEVSKVPELWCAKTHPDSFNVLFNLSSRIVKATKDKKIRIVIISTIEGDNFVSDNFDGYFNLHSSLRILGLPKKSVVIISGNLNAAKQYTKWCIDNQKEEYIEFLEGVEWDGKSSNNSEKSNIPVEIKEYSKPFNSLNRAHRNHRSEHLYFLAENKMNGLISGGAWFNINEIQRPEYIDVDYEYYKEVLLKNYPKVLDVIDLINNVPNLVNNYEIYTDSQLSIITESHFNQSGGLFITEKTFRPILVGHPFMILGQQGTLSKLRQWGFKTDFDGLDQSYDDVLDNKERFTIFHRSLRNWYFTDPELKRTMLYKWKNIIDHNFYHYKKLDFKKMMFDDLKKSCKKYFTEVY